MKKEWYWNIQNSEDHSPATQMNPLQYWVFLCCRPFVIPKKQQRGTEEFLWATRPGSLHFPTSHANARCHQLQGRQHWNTCLIQSSRLSYHIYLPDKAPEPCDYCHKAQEEGFLVVVWIQSHISKAQLNYSCWQCKVDALKWSNDKSSRNILFALTRSYLQTGIVISHPPSFA